MNRTQWVNTEPDEAAPHALLHRIARQLPPDIIDGVWIFPTRRAGGVESTVIVVTALCDDPERRRVLTAHFAVTRDRRGRPGIAERLHEHALAPTHAVGRAVEGVLRRLGEDILQPPRAEAIDGDPDRWRALLIDLGAPPPRPEPETESGDPVTSEGPFTEEIAEDAES